MAKSQYDMPEEKNPLMPVGAQGPIQLSVQLLILTAILSFVVSGVVLSFLFLGNVLTWTPVLYCMVPLALWGGFALIPTWIYFVRAAQLIPRAFSTTASAWNARAEAATRIQEIRKEDVEFVRPQIVEAQPAPRPIPAPEGRMIPMNTNRGTQYVAVPDAAQVAPGLEGTEMPPPPGQPVERRRECSRFWKVEIPDPENPGHMKTVKVREGELRMFLEGLFSMGWKRREWCPKLLPRPKYEACMKLVTDTNIIIGRGKGTTGQLSIQSPEQAFEAFGLAYRRETDAA